MADVMYNNAKQLFLTGGWNLSTDNITALLVNTTNYTVSATHSSLTDVPVNARIGTGVSLASKTVTNGTFNAASVTFSSVTGATASAILLYKSTGVDSTSTLLAYIDTAASGLPLTPNGNNVTVTWDAAGIFHL